MKSVLFIHRSVGRNLIKYGNLYGLLEKYAHKFSFVDYDHNTGILTTPDSRETLGYVFPGGNTYPSNMEQLFTKSNTKTKPILDWISKYDVVVLKSCYPTTKIRSNKELEILQESYKGITDYFAKTDQQLILFSPPPMRPILTRKDWANRARQLADWMKSYDFNGKVEVFDLFDELAAKPNERGANSLRREYRRPFFFDAHPNRKANEAVAQKFVNFLSNLPLRG